MDLQFSGYALFLFFSIKYLQHFLSHFFVYKISVKIKGDTCSALSQIMRLFKDQSILGIVAISVCSLVKLFELVMGLAKIFLTQVRLGLENLPQNPKFYNFSL